MAAILHRVRIAAPQAEVFRAIAQGDVLRAFHLHESDIVLCLTCLDPPRRVEWSCDAGPPEWSGTHVAFDVKRDGADTVVELAHGRWREPSNAMADCSTRWARILLGMKQNLEIPEPEDLYV